MKNADQTQENTELKTTLCRVGVTAVRTNFHTKKQDSALENKDHKIQTLEEYIRYMVQKRFGSSSEN